MLFNLCRERQRERERVKNGEGYSFNKMDLVKCLTPLLKFSAAHTRAVARTGCVDYLSDGTSCLTVAHGTRIH
jgi:hypothetical protein